MMKKISIALVLLATSGLFALQAADNVTSLRGNMELMEDSDAPMMKRYNKDGQPIELVERVVGDLLVRVAVDDPLHASSSLSCGF